MLRVLYLGQKWIGEKCFDFLTGKQGDALKICGVVSNAGTDIWWKSNAIYKKSLDDGIPFLSNEKRYTKTIINMITENKINTIMSVQHPWILSKEILKLVDFFAFNLHNAKLPDYKGHNTCNHALLNGDLNYTSTIHWMDKEVDTGDIIFEETFDIDPKETTRSLYEKAIQSGEKIFRKLVDYLLQGKEIPRRPIEGQGFFYSRNSIDSLRQIKNIHDFIEVDSKARAFYFPPFEPAYYSIEGQKYYVLPGAFPYMQTE